VEAIEDAVEKSPWSVVQTVDVCVRVVLVTSSLTFVGREYVESSSD